MAQVKSCPLNLRISERLDDWLDDQCELLGQSKSEVVRYWLNTCMLQYKNSVELAGQIVREKCADVEIDKRKR